MIYFDNAATTKVKPEALEAYNRISLGVFGNPSSRHGAGYQANHLLDEARNTILKSLGLTNYKIVFTSGATESNNLTLRGVAHQYKNRGNKIISSKVEHPSVLNTLKDLESEGFKVVYLNVNETGEIDYNQLQKELDKETILVSIMSINNETGSTNDLAKINELRKAFPKVFFHTDATQSFGKVNIDLSSADLISFSSHKFGGLKGNGGLILKKTISLKPTATGGEQEDNLRAGTVNVAGAYSTAIALKNSLENIEKCSKSITFIHDFMLKELSEMDGISINSPLQGSPYILNFSLLKKKASVVVEALSNKEIYVSSVSACSSKGEPISYVLKAMGKSDGDAMNSIRISFCEDNTIEEAKSFIKALTAILSEVHDR